jgi:hypothetical protein
MSWHLENCGTRGEVKAAIDEMVAAPHGMPKPVGDYLKDAVDAVDLTNETGIEDDRYFVHVKSTGHRPSNGGQEECLVRRIRRGPWKIPMPAKAA